MNKQHDPKSVITSLNDKLVDLRRTIHQHAEVSGKESGTAKTIKGFIEQFGPDKVKTGIGGNGLIFTFGKDNGGPHVMIRSELDALPIKEINDMPYASESSDVSHKCGHDGHMAIVCGVAGLLHQLPPDSGKVSLLFQPAEETGEGAQWMLDDKNFDIKPDYAFALHNLPGFKKNSIIVRDGIFASASSGFHAVLKGKTSHAAHPEEGKNPAPAIAILIQELLSMPQLSTDFDDPALVTIIYASLGAREAYGTSAGTGEVMATLRSHRNVTMKELKKEARELATHIGKLHKLNVETGWAQEFDATVNDNKCVDHIRHAADELGFEVEEAEVPFAWSEDFGRFTSAFKGAMFGLGSGVKHAGLHNPDFDFPDEIIPTGSLMFYQIIRQTLDNK